MMLTFLQLLHLLHLVVAVAFDNDNDLPPLPHRHVTETSLPSISGFALASRRLLAGGSVLATEQFYNEFNARAARLKRSCKQAHAHAN
jgi:hypothetical protein